MNIYDNKKIIKIILIRHAETLENKKKLYCGSTNSGISESGKKKLLKIKKKYYFPKTDLYYSSIMKRCIETTNILFKKIKKIHFSKKIREVNFGIFEKKGCLDLKKNFYKIWFYDKKIKNAELFSLFMYRILSKLIDILFDLIEKNKKSATLICHSCVIKIFIIVLFEKKLNAFFNIKIKNCLGYILFFKYYKKNSLIKFYKIKKIKNKKNNFK